MLQFLYLGKGKYKHFLILYDNQEDEKLLPCDGGANSESGKDAKGSDLLFYY